MAEAEAEGVAAGREASADAEAGAAFEDEASSVVFGSLFTTASAA